MNCPKCNKTGTRTVGMNFKCAGCKLSFNDKGKQWATKSKLKKPGINDPITKPSATIHPVVQDQYTDVIIVTDQSGSMRGSKQEAARVGINKLLDELKVNAHKNPNHKIRLTRIEFAPVKVTLLTQDPRSLCGWDRYDVGSDTPLYDAVGEAVEVGYRIKTDRPQTCIFIYAFTDGKDEAQNPQKWKRQTLHDAIKALGKDWTVTLMAAEEDARRFAIDIGIPSDNVQMCENSGAGITQGTESVILGTRSLMAGRAAGTVRGTETFFVGVKADADPVAAGLIDVTKDFHCWTIDKEAAILEFVESKGVAYVTGSCFYQLTKDEKAVQGDKPVIIRDNKTGKIFTSRDTPNNAAVRKLVGLPLTGNAKVRPDSNNAHLDVFVQSKSVNRKLVRGTKLLHLK